MHTQRFYLTDQKSNRSQMVAEVTPLKGLGRFKRFLFLILLSGASLSVPIYTTYLFLTLMLLALLFLYWDFNRFYRIVGAVICPACKTTIQIRMRVSSPVSKRPCPHCKKLLQLSKMN